jgi:hypothetical protein
MRYLEDRVRELEFQVRALTKAYQDFSNRVDVSFRLCKRTRDNIRYVLKKVNKQRRLKK